MVRAAEFSDLQGLIAGLSTGIQNELDKLGQREGRRAGPVAAGRVVRVAPRPVFLAGREGLLAELGARLAGMTAQGRGWWRCAGWAGRARPAWRWSMRTGIWPGRGGLAVRPRRIRRCWRPGSVSWPLSSARPMAGIRWPRCTRCWRRRGAVAAGVR